MVFAAALTVGCVGDTADDAGTICAGTGGVPDPCPPCPKPGVCEPCPPPCDCPDGTYWDPVAGCVDEAGFDAEDCWSPPASERGSKAGCEASYSSCDYIPEGRCFEETCPHGGNGVCAPRNALGEPGAPMTRQD